MILSILPLLNKMNDLQWLKAFMRGVGPAVIGALAVSLVEMAPHAAPDPFTWFLLALTVLLLLLSKVHRPVCGSSEYSSSRSEHSRSAADFRCLHSRSIAALRRAPRRPILPLECHSRSRGRREPPGHQEQ